ncbi:MAG: tRNA pseudouridine(55) synthase TruB [Clostridia bacterium]|nr:tRNA pseudouridine(55) synthase TruB [Clostridia bacterium]
MQGLLLLNKPQGITSYKAVAAVKRLTGEKRVGHTGTLDPMATGVLPIFIGRPTALSAYMLDGDKSYKASVKLGTVTDTGDITGKIIEQNEVNITPEMLDKTLSTFIGKIKQTPPMYSALKQNGVPLYKLAREGKTVDIKEREVEIYSIKITEPLKNREFGFSADVSKGTYIRSLAMDIGKKLGCGATLTSLCRTDTCGFSLENCVDLELLNTDNIVDYIKSEEIAVKYMREISVTFKQAVRFCNGGQLSLERLKVSNILNGETFRVKYNGLFLGIGIADIENELLRIKCIINYPQE